MRSEKDELRAQIRALQRSLDYEWVRRKSLLLQERAICHPIFEAAGMVSAYISHGKEPRTDRILHAASASRKGVCVPVWDRDREAYALAEWAREIPLENGPFGIPQPAALNPVDPARVDLIFVPVIAVDPQGHRVGHGKGDIDRLLADFEGTKVALAFDFQVQEACPEEEHDVRMDYVLTPTRTLATRASRAPEGA